MKTLILYATTYGFTKECVEDLRKLLNGDVDMVNIMTSQVDSLGEYNNIIIGGSIYIGQIQKKLKNYCIEHKDMLKSKRLALFLCCGMTDQFDQTLKNSYPAELLNQAIAKECFGGELRIDKMKLTHKIITNMMKKVTEKQGKENPEKLFEGIQRLANKMNT